MTKKERLIGQRFYASGQEVDGVVVGVKGCRSYPTCFNKHKCVGYMLNVLLIDSKHFGKFTPSGLHFCGWKDRLTDWETKRE